MYEAFVSAGFTEFSTLGFAAVGFSVVLCACTDAFDFGFSATLPVSAGLVCSALVCFASDFFADFTGFVISELAVPCSLLVAVLVALLSALLVADLSSKLLVSKERFEVEDESPFVTKYSP
ncbi:Uncharacterised protein [Chlamydia trachomatis]|nr:Uncharacterised protein [Chlamydia trachomatis]